jgi:SAM-dependent methyltransferase
MKDDVARALGLDLRYDCDERRLPAPLVTRFVRLDLGEEGREYLERAVQTRPGRAKTALHRVLRNFMSDFDVNALLDMYPMHLLGTNQWKALLGSERAHRLLDVGAGRGDVTRTLSPLADVTVTSETSRLMARRLRAEGFACVEADLALNAVPDPGYDVVTCLNVIDRCAKPRSLLSNLARALAPGGRLVLATPLPFDPFVYDGPASMAPSEMLDISNDGWEQSVASLAEKVLYPLGLVVESVSRVPYICRGDADRPVYVLDDAVLVCRKPR